MPGAGCHCVSCPCVLKGATFPKKFEPDDGVSRKLPGERMARDDKTSSRPAPATSPPQLQIPFREFIVLTALLNSLTAMSIDIMLPALPQIGSTFGIPTANDQQLVVTFYFLGLAIGQLFYGPLSDRHGRKPLLLVGLSIYLVAALAAVTVGEFKHLLWARMLQGFGGAATRVLAVAIVRDMFAGRQMARVMSMVMTVFIVVPVFAPMVGQGIAGLGGWRAIFYFLIGIALLDMAWSWMRLPETRGPKAATGAGPAPIPLTYRQAAAATLASRPTAGYAVASGFLFGCLTTYVATAQQVFVDVYKLGAKFPLAFGGYRTWRWPASSGWLRCWSCRVCGARRISPCLAC
jgi:MFS transporter, DHA1 family, multidrug resistance protein